VDWATVLPGIAALLARLTGLQTFERDSPPKFTDPVLKAKLEFAVTSCVAVGRDERRYTYDGTVVDPNARMVLTIDGNREFVLAVKCVSYDHTPLHSAEFFLERIYTKLSWPSSQAALNAVGISFTGAEKFVNVSANISDADRVFSLGVKDFRFLASVTDTVPPDPTDVSHFGDSPIGTIDHVQLTSVYLYGVDGNPLGKQVGPIVVP